MQILAAILLLFYFIIAGASPAFTQQDLLIPPTKSNVAAIGMGDANVADGSAFNAASYNPALLGYAPSRYECIGLGLNFSANLLPTFSFLKNHRADIRDIYKDLKQGLNNSDSTLIDRGLNSADSVLSNVAGKPYGLGIGPYVSMRIGEHFGVQIYNNTNALLQMYRGDVASSLLAIPRPINLNDPATQQQVSQAVDRVANTLQSAVGAFLSNPNVQQEINAFVSGAEDENAFLVNVSTIVGDPGIKESLKKVISYSVFGQLPSVIAVGISDTVMLGTLAGEPLTHWPDLTIGANLKIVNRRATVQALSPIDFAGGASDITRSILKDIRTSSTRLGFDLGFIYKFQPSHLSLGLTAEDLIGKRATASSSDPYSLLNQFETDPAPTVLRVGLKWQARRDLFINFDVDDILGNTAFYQDSGMRAHVKLGAQYSLFPWLALRGGFGNNSLSTGWGLFFGHFGIDYGYARDSLSQTYSHFFQFRYLFGLPKERPMLYEAKSFSPSALGSPSVLNSQISAPKNPSKAPTPIPVPIKLEQADPSRRIEKAKQLSEEKKWQAARVQYLIAAKELPPDDPRHVLVEGMIGLASVRLTEFKAAKKHYWRAIDFAKKHEIKSEEAIEAHIGFAYCLEKSGDPKSAVVIYRIALKLMSGNDKNRAVVLKRLTGLGASADPQK